MAAQIQIRSDYSDGLESKLLKKVCRHRDQTAVYVTQFHRFGFSGARLLLVYFSRRPAGVPFLLKVSEFEKAEKEYDATRVLQSDVQDARFAADRIFRANDGKVKWGGLLYEHRGTDRPDEAAAPRALRELIYNPRTSKSALRSILGEVFNKLHNAHTKHRAKRVALRACFKRYFRKDVASERVRYVLGRQANFRTMTFLEAPIYNPLIYLRELPEEANLDIGLVHGDLHPDNIIIDRNDVAHLIDFAWAHENRDVLVDYTLLENSIRFMAFPSAGPMNLADQLRVDRELLDERGPSRIESLNLRSARRQDYERLACAVGVIRDRAHELLNDQFSMQKYLLAQFILLYGLLSYPQYDLYASTRALGLSAARLKDIGLPS